MCQSLHAGKTAVSIRQKEWWPSGCETTHTHTQTKHHDGLSQHSPMTLAPINALDNRIRSGNRLNFYDMRKPPSEQECPVN